MKNFLIKNSKIIYFILGILAFVSLLSSLVYMTQYRYVRINYSTQSGLEFDGAMKLGHGTDQESLYRFFLRIGMGDFSKESVVSQYMDKEDVTEEVALEYYEKNKAIFETLNSFRTTEIKVNADGYALNEKNEIIRVKANGSTDQTNGKMLKLEADGTLTREGQEFASQKYQDNAREALVYINGYGAPNGFTYEGALKVYNYKNKLDGFNDLIVTYSLVSIVCFALLLVFSNHSRRIYYSSNLVAGIIFPLVIIVFSIIMIVKNIDLMNTFLEDADFYNVISATQNPDNFLITKIIKYYQMGTSIWSKFDCDVTTFIVYSVIFGFVACYSLFVMIYSCFRYSSSSSERRSIMERVGNSND